LRVRESKRFHRSRIQDSNFHFLLTSPQSSALDRSALLDCQSLQITCVPGPSCARAGKRARAVGCMRIPSGCASLDALDAGVSARYSHHPPRLIPCRKQPALVIRRELQRVERLVAMESVLPQPLRHVHDGDAAVLRMRNQNFFYRPPPRPSDDICEDLGPFTTGIVSLRARRPIRSRR